MHAEKERTSFYPTLFEPQGKTNRIHLCIFGKNHAVHPIHAFGQGLLVRKLQSLDGVQTAIIFVAHPALALNDLRDALQLCHAQGRLHVGQAKIKPQGFMIETPLRLKTQISQRSRLFSEFLIIGEHHPSLSGGDELVGIETETTQRPKASTPSPYGVMSISARKILCAMDFCRILDDGKPVLLRQAAHGIHVHRMLIYMHRHDGPCAWRNLRLDLTDIHTPGARIAIDKNRYAIITHNCQGTGNNSKGGHNDFIARFETEASDSDLQGGCPIADGDAVAFAAVGSPAVFKLVD